MVRFAAVLKDGTVVTGVDKNNGGDASTVQASLIGVDRIYSTHVAFAAVLMDGTVVTTNNRKVVPSLETGLRFLRNRVLKAGC